MTTANLNYLREMAEINKEQNAVYNTETKTLVIKNGDMKGKYTNISFEAAKELAR
jgi:hypothetical protein